MVASYLLVLSMLAVIAIIDYRTHKIPNISCMLILLIGIVSHMLPEANAELMDSFLGILAGFLPMFFLYCLTGLGAGDVKLTSALGSLVGAQHILLIISYSFLISGIVAILMLIKSRAISDMALRYYHFIYSLVQRREFSYPAPGESSVASRQMPLAPGITLASFYIMGAGLLTSLSVETWWR